MADNVRQNGGARYTGFLNDRGRALAEMVLRRENCRDYTFFGGYQGAERCMLCVFEDLSEVAFPLETIKITQKGLQKQLTHRDYLGALLGTGIKRESMGDILPDEKGAMVFVNNAVSMHIMQQLTSVGSTTVIAETTNEAPPEAESDGKLFSVSVSSLRLDAVLAQMLNVSRGKAAAVINSQKVQVNHVPVSAVHRILQSGDTVTIQGTGKFKIGNTGGKSRKGRTFIEYLKF